MTIDTSTLMERSGASTEPILMRVCQVGSKYRTEDGRGCVRLMSWRSATLTCILPSFQLVGKVVHTMLECLTMLYAQGVSISLIPHQVRYYKQIMSAL